MRATRINHPPEEGGVLSIELLVATGLTDCAADNGRLLPLVAAVERTTGRLPQLVPADSGYAGEANFTALEAQEVAAGVALARERKAVRAIDPAEHPAPKRMAERLKTAVRKIPIPSIAVASDFFYRSDS